MVMSKAMRLIEEYLDGRRTEAIDRGESPEAGDEFAPALEFLEKMRGIAKQYRAKLTVEDNKVWLFSGFPPRNGDKLVWALARIWPKFQNVTHNGFTDEVRAYGFRSSHQAPWELRRAGLL